MCTCPVEAITMVENEATAHIAPARTVCCRRQGRFVTPRSLRTTVRPYVIAEPRAGALMESLRAFGYAFATAIADLIDNSVAAGATRIEIHAQWAGTDSYVSIADDGQGMSEETLVEAMRLGTQGPNAVRDPSDLGRFGLGLKTASLSQCRRLTVRSKEAAGTPSAAQWDIDHVITADEWQLLRPSDAETDARLAILGGDAGTTVLWEHLDRLVGEADEDDQGAEKRFLAHLRELEAHLAMVFHRFLARPKRLEILLNGIAIESWDPFLLDEDATQRLGEDRLPYDGETVTVRPYCLPHVSKLSAATHARAAGPKGWNAQQGFYVYRNMRLLVAGGWLGLGMKSEEHYKLARIQVDIPTVLDAAWQIDVRKSIARPPGPLREDLQRIANLARRSAAEIYRHRGRVLVETHAKSHVLLWNRFVRHGKVGYRVNREHPLVKAVARHAPDAADDVEALLRFVEETIPAPVIAIEHAERPDEQAAPFELADLADVLDVMRRIWRELRTRGESVEGAREILYSMEPFARMPEAIAAFDGELEATEPGA
jgi:hypothetical protein